MQSNSLKIPSFRDTRAVLFDHDDTLVQTIDIKWEEQRYIAKTYYHKDLTDTELREHWGKPFPEMIGLLYETSDIEQAIRYNKAVHESFPKRLHNDAIAVLAYLAEQHLKLGLVTSASRYILESDLARLKVPENIFKYTQTADETDYHKPNPLVFEPALMWLASYNIAPRNVIYIGDSLDDLTAARGAGFQFIGVTTGITTKTEFNHRGALAINCLGELVALLYDINQYNLQLSQGFKLQGGDSAAQVN
ncbi:MAG TPA: HAD family hydrolase [Candidatus Saccharimonadales bacterium]|nr:HAD family hydrolase [Candidatus Saccharimonadales bacterium]